MTGLPCEVVVGEDGGDEVSGVRGKVADEVQQTANAYVTPQHVHTAREQQREQRLQATPRRMCGQHSALTDAKAHTQTHSPAHQDESLAHV